MKHGKTIGKALALVVAAAALTGPAFAYSGEQYVVCNLNPQGDNFLAMRSCGSTRCRIVKKLAPDTFLLTAEPTAENGWRDVMILKGLQDESYSGLSGWVSSKYICKILY